MTTPWTKARSAKSSSATGPGEPRDVSLLVNPGHPEPQTLLLTLFPNELQRSEVCDIGRYRLRCASALFKEVTHGRSSRT